MSKKNRSNPNNQQKGSNMPSQDADLKQIQDAAANIVETQQQAQQDDAEAGQTNEDVPGEGIAAGDQIPLEDEVEQDPAPVQAPEVINQGTQAEEKPAAPEVKVEAPQVAEVAEVKQTVSDTQSTEAVEVELTDFQRLQEKINASGTPTQQSLIYNLESYISKMKPGVPMDVTRGSALQSQLWHTIRAVAEDAKPEDFRSLWHILLMYFKEHKDAVFGPRHIFRFAESWTRDVDHLAGFQSIVNLLRLTADPATREEGLKQVDISRSLEKGFTEQGRTRIVQYYKV